MLGVVNRSEIHRATKVIEQLPRQFALRHLLASLDPREIADVRADGIGDSDERLLACEADFSKGLALCHAGEFALPANSPQAPCLRGAH